MSANTSIQETNWQEFNKTMLQSNEVKKVVVVNKEVAQIYLKEDVLDKEKHKAVSQKSFGNGLNKGPHYFFEIGSVDAFNDDLKEAQKDFDDDEVINVIYDTQKDVFGDALGWVFPYSS